MVNLNTAVLIVGFTVVIFLLYSATKILEDASLKYGESITEPIMAKGLISISYSDILYFGGIFDKISPQDPLTARFIFVDNYAFPLDVRPHLQLTGGDGQETVKDLKDYSCIVVTTCAEEFNFTAGNEGTNNIVFVLDIYNHTTNTFLGQQNATARFTVVSYADKLHDITNLYTLLGIIVSGGIGIATVAALFSTRNQASEHTKELREQNQLLRKQNEFIQKQAVDQNRSWIGITGGIQPIGIINEKNEIKSLDEWSKLLQNEKDVFNGKKIEWRMTLKNYGSTPAVNVLIRWYIARDSMITARKELKSTEYGNPFVVMPSGEHPIVLLFPLNISLDVLNSTVKTFICIEIKYKSSNSDEDRIFGLTYERNATGFTIVESWDEKSENK